MRLKMGSMKRKIAWLSLVLLVALLYFWVQSRYSEKPLFFGIKSGISQIEFQGFITQKNFRASQTENRDPFDKFVVANFKYKSFTGKLSAEFYENELCAISFYPHQYEAFLKDVSGKPYKKGEVFESTQNGVYIRNAEWDAADGITWRDNPRYQALQMWVLGHT